MICSNNNLFLNEANQLKYLFVVNNYISRVFHQVFRKFMVKYHSLPDQSLPDNERDTDYEQCFVVGVGSKWFANRLFKLMKRQFGIKLGALFVTFKINHYFQLKSNTPHVLSSDVVYQFTCSYDKNLSYIG